MKKLLSLATVALVALAVGVSAKAAPVSPQTVALQRRVTWQEHRIDALQERRAYLHRYIRHLRKTTTPIVVHHTPTVSSPSVPSTPTTTSYSGGWSDELRLVGFPESAIPHMLYIIQRESGGCPTAVYGYGCNGTGHAYAGGPACGLVQLYPCPGPQALDPITNLRYGLQKYQASGFAPWGG